VGRWVSIQRDEGPRLEEQKLPGFQPLRGRSTGGYLPRG